MASREMLQWQYKQILAQLEQVELHAGDPTCPCVMVAKGEYCLPKHLLLLESLAAETAAMVEGKDGEMFGDLQGEAEEKHKETKDRIVCHTGKGEPSDLVEWARNWRKKVEGIYYVCFTSHVKAKVAQLETPLAICGGQAEMFEAELLPVCPVCLAGAPKAHSPKPVCTSSQLEKLQRCAEKVKAKLPPGCGASEWKKPQSQRAKGCYSPFAVCSAKVGCRPGRKE